MRSLVLLLLSICLSAATATLFDGSRSSGALSLAGDGRIRVGATELALADLDTLVLGDGQPARIEGDLGVLLRDGSWLPARSIAAATTADRIVVHSPFGDLELPLEIVAGWGDPSPPDSEPGGDAVLVESGLLGGRVLGISDGAVRFQSRLDPEPLILQVPTVRGMRLDGAIRQPTGARLRAQTSAMGAGLDLILVDGGVALGVAPSARLDSAAIGSMTLRIEGGRRTYLSDLKPSSAREDGMFGVVWPHVRDGAIGGGPIQLGGRRHAKGLTVHSVANLTWRLAGAMVRLHAQVGIADQIAPEGDCIAIIRGDGRELWKARVRGGDAVRLIDLDLTGVAQLELQVDAGERHDIGDHLVLADAQLIRR
jgi:hypothetical protein